MIEVARRTTGEMPAHEFLSKLMGKSFFSKKSNEDKLADVLIRFERLCRTGELDIPGELRSLGHDLWEIKTSALRLPFYYCKEHTGITAIRLTHVFEKSRNKTADGKCPRRQINYAKLIRNEDAQQ